MNDRPAALGGQPIFPSRQPFERPTLPPYSSLDGAMADIFASGMLTKGKHLADFEERLAAHLGVRHAVGLSSCTVGLLLVYRALGLTGEVIVPSFTFMATVHPLLWNNLTPVFADVDPLTWNLDPDAAEAAITPRTSAIVGVHVFGNPAPVERLEELARRRGLTLILDAAHAFGSRRRGQPVGRFGVAEVFSTSPTKPLVTGEGGIITTNDDVLARLLRIGREYGNQGDYDSIFPGLNARMQEFSALLGLRTLETLEENVLARNRLVELYRQRLSALPGITFQQIDPADRCSFKDLTIMVDETAFGLGRDALAHALLAEGVDTRRYYDPPVHRHTLYRDIWSRQGGSLPVTDTLASRTLSLPMYAHLGEDRVDGICHAVERIHAHAGEVRALPGA
jgi:dTDP-4-amino-4,6-dideoxygalactose transaminase